MASIEKRGNGWRVVWRHQGKKRSTIPWGTVDLAEKAATMIDVLGTQVTPEHIEEALDPNGARARSGPATLREWCLETWLPSKTRITSGVRGQYEAQLRNRILPVLGDMPVDEIKPTDVGRLVNALRAADLKEATVTRYYAVLHGAFAAAVADGLRADNPCERSDFVRDQVAEDDEGAEGRVYLTPAEYQQFLAAFPPQHRALLELLVGTGARWSEATALRVGDLIPLGRWDHAEAAWAKGAGPRLRIARAWKRDAKSRPYLGTTKGRQRRTLAIDDELHALLSQYAAGRADDELLLTASRGGRIVYANFVNRVWHPAVVQARRCPLHPPEDQGRPLDGATGPCGRYGGVRSRRYKSVQACEFPVVPGLTRCRHHRGPDPDAVSTCGCSGVLRDRPTPHDLRHTNAAWLFADPDVAPLVISRRLGHADLSTTSEIYGGMMPTAEEAAVVAIAAARSPRALPDPEPPVPRSAVRRKPVARPRPGRIIGRRRSSAVRRTG